MNKLLLFAAMISATMALDACTGIVRTAENGDVVYARTMEFGADLISFDLLTVPKGTAHKAQATPGERGLTWVSKYHAVGFAPFGQPILADGLNDQGLGCGAFYMPGWADYQNVAAADKPKAISNLDFVSWVLGNFKSVEEVRQALKETKVYGIVFPAWGIVPPLHYIVADTSGDIAVVEYVKGELHIYAAPLNTITNAPTYDWHNINARNYIGLKALNDPDIHIKGKEFAAFGQGSGSIGLPGDFTPPSRFIRAAFLGQVVMPTKNGVDEVKSAFTILNQFDIPRGAVRAVHDGKEVFEVTQWTSASDLKNLRYYFHTQYNRTVRAFDLKNWQPQSVAPVAIPVGQLEEIEIIKV